MTHILLMILGLLLALICCLLEETILKGQDFVRFAKTVGFIMFGVGLFGVMQGKGA